MEVYVARQPILDRNRKLFAYELLFRGGTENAFPEIDGDIATSQLLSNSFLNFDINLVSNNKLAFVNFTETLLLQGLPNLFPKDKIVVEVLEDVAPNEKIQNAIIGLAKQGYCIALDDFEYDPSLEPLIDLCQIIKIDIRITPLEEAEELIRQLSGRSITFLAEKVETYEEFQQTLNIGFDLFQGYFFSKPEILETGTIKSSSLGVIQLIQELYKEDFDINRVERKINVDVNIAYKLLRYINSAAFGREQEIKSIKHAITYLGINETRRFLSLIALSEISSDKPDELVLSSIIRGRFCELLGEICKKQFDGDELFMLGLFSHIDAMFDSDMESIMEYLPLAHEIKSALIAEAGELANILKLCIYYEAGDWKRCLQLAHKLEIREDKLPKCYISSLEWANSFAAI